MKHLHHTPAPRGFTLFIALIMTSVILAVGLALLDISYKEVILSSTSKNSTIAFYNADGALECALYWDSQLAFDYTAPKFPAQITCGGAGNTFNFTTDDTSIANTHIRTFSVPCTGNSPPGNYATVMVYKVIDQVTGQVKTQIYSSGYDTCLVNDANRTERGLEAKY